MVKISKNQPKIEIQEISDADNPPKKCPRCGSTKLSRHTYHIRELQDLGDWKTARRLRYEQITWKCSSCKVSFTIGNQDAPEGARYTATVIDYAKYRVLKKGDSGSRVAEDLRVLHNIKVTAKTIISWINSENDNENLPTEFVDSIPEDEFSGILSIDATFKSVKPKKNEQQKDKNKPFILYLTYLEDGRLAAYWDEENLPKKPKKP